MLNSLKKVIIGSLLMAVVLPGCGTNTIANNQDLFAPVLNTNESIDGSVEATGLKYKIVEIIGIGAVYEKKINEQGIKYTDALLAATAKRSDRLKFAEKTGISPKLLLIWANHIDIMHVKGIGPKQSNWLEAVGVDSMKELSHRLVNSLYPKLELANNIDPKRKFVQRMPSVKTVQAWIDLAKTTPAKVEE